MRDGGERLALTLLIRWQAVEGRRTEDAGMRDAGISIFALRTVCFLPKDCF